MGGTTLAASGMIAMVSDCSQWRPPIASHVSERKGVPQEAQKTIALGGRNGTPENGSTSPRARNAAC